jgi:drug/metabolite transporter (DMT)-like permease
MLTRKQLWLLVILTLMWGINWPMMKLSVREMSPLYFRGITMLLGALCLMFWYRSKRIPLWPQPHQWPDVVRLGLPNVLGWHTLAILGVTQLASGRAAILGFTMPIWTILLGAIFFREKLTQRALLALCCVAAAVGLLTWHELSSMAGKPMGVIFMLGAALCWALGTLMMRNSHHTLGVEALTVWMMLLSSLCILAFALVFETIPGSNYSGMFWVSLLWGVLINYGVAQVIWFGMAKSLPPVTSVMSITAVPIIGTMTATFIVGEIPHWQDWVAVIFVCVAIGTAVLRRKPA